ncbi:MAG: hypothetical protein JXR64_13560 [Spirochaetales bacterium]|nr:hypothetical protein [Spirochaetales bacterium]
MNGNVASNLQHNYHVDGLQLSIPGLSTFNLYCTDERNPEIANDPDIDWRNWDVKTDESGQDGLTSGIDCSGFVSEAANYNGENYILSERENTSGIRVDSWFIADKDKITYAKCIIPRYIYARSCLYCI